MSNARMPVRGADGRPTEKACADELMRLRQFARDRYRIWGEKGWFSFTPENWKFRLDCIEDITFRELQRLEIEERNREPG